MSEAEVCPQCSARFSARKALVASGVGIRSNAFARNGAQMTVRCPNCLHIFSPRTLRLFGVLSLTGLRWLAVGLVIACVVLAAVLPPR